MALQIGTNLASLSILRHINKNSNDQLKTYQRIASGERIVEAGDDPAGLAIGEDLKSHIRSSQQAERNTNDAISYVQVAEGGLSEIAEILIRMRALSIQSASDSLSERERSFVNEEFQSLIQEVDRIANVTAFNEVPLLNGEGYKDILQFQVGIFNNEPDRQFLNLEASSVTADNLEISDLSVDEQDSALESLDSLDEGLRKVSAVRAQLGALQNRLHITVNNLTQTREGISAARSRIVDTDLAFEVSNLVQQNITQAAGVSVLAQANMTQGLVLRLLD